MWYKISRLYGVLLFFKLLYNQTIPGITSTYASVDDIDLYVGGFSERPILGANVGPTFTCLIAEHFKQIKYSDRYFYELGGQPHSFSSGSVCKIFTIVK